MLESEDKQFTLDNSGVILFQADASNPLPGVAIAKITKGEFPLKPAIELNSPDVFPGLEADAVRDRVERWLQSYLNLVLSGLPVLNAVEDAQPESVRLICSHLYDSFGITRRSFLEDQISKLDENSRKTLRQKGIKLGPVLVFMPNLNKPAPVGVKAMLWNIWNDKPLPAPTPKEGLTSFAVEDRDAIDANYQRIISYPVYGNRAIRVDILDRIISAVYDSAEQGKFQAKHEMAEWLGCSIPDLYSILEGLGHKKIYDPAEEVKSEVVNAEDVEDVKAPDAAVESAAAEAVAPAPAVENATENADVPVADGVAEVKSPAPEQVKPDLATFVLRKGKAYSDKKTASGQNHKAQNNNDRLSGFKADANQKDRRKKSGFKKNDRAKSGNRSPAVHSAPAAKPATSSPFDVLKDLKVKGKD